MVKVGSHYDEHEGWARNPHLREVVRISRPVKKKRRSSALISHVLCVGLGYLIAWACS